MTACWICDGTASPDAALGALGFVRCAACGFVFRPELDGAARETYESGAYEDVRGAHYTEPEVRARRRDARVRLAFLAPHARGGRLLDIGAAGGAFVAEAQASGYDAHGIEPTPAFARYAREVLGVDVAEGTLEAAELAAASLDVATMWHVLEHVPRPLGQLRRIAAALRPGGVLAVEVPNAGSESARRAGAAWPSLEPDVHVNQFAPATLRAALEAAGLRVVELHTVPITPFLSTRARLGLRHLAARVKAAWWLRSTSTRHPRGHELLRAIAVATPGRAA